MLLDWLGVPTLPSVVQSLSISWALASSSAWSLLNVHGLKANTLIDNKQRLVTVNQLGALNIVHATQIASKISRLFQILLLKLICHTYGLDTFPYTVCAFVRDSKEGRTRVCHVSSYLPPCGVRGYPKHLCPLSYYRRNKSLSTAFNSSLYESWG